MRRSRLYAVALTLLAGVTPPTGAAAFAQEAFSMGERHESGIRILDPMTGTVCLRGEEPFRVCSTSAIIDIIGETMCDWGEDMRYPCTWYAYQFDYENADPDQSIICDVRRSTRTVFGPDTEEVTGPTTARYTVEIDSTAGHLFHPSFNTYAPVDDTLHIREVHQCSYAGTTLFEVDYHLRFQPEE